MHQYNEEDSRDCGFKLPNAVHRICRNCVFNISLLEVVYLTSVKKIPEM